MDISDRTETRDLRAPRRGRGACAGEGSLEQGLAGSLLDFLVEHSPALFSVDELDRLLASPDRDRQQERFLLEEAVKILVGDGLAQRLGEFVFASHAGVQAACLLRER
ncbi:MAG TPA: hypothetical protein VNT55_09935 [Baekduia sp.]|nr:hypothetical protein [Baekduia sp.]